MMRYTLINNTKGSKLVHFASLFMVFLLFTSCSGIESWIHDDINEDFIKRSFTRSALTEDLFFLQTQMAARHPVYHKLIDENTISTKIDSIVNIIEDEMTRTEYFQLIGKLNPYFKDGHSIIFPLLAEGTFDEDNGKFLFPFGVFVNNQSLYLNTSYNNYNADLSIKKGAKIVSINGVSGETILKELAEYGHGETAILRMHMSTLLFRYWLKAIYDWSGGFELVLTYKNEQDTINVSNADYWESEQDKLGDRWLEILPNDIAYLKIGTFDVDEDSDYESFVEDSFAEMLKKQISKLIIDIRGNTGGQSDAGAEIIKYLTDKQLNQASSAIEKLSDDNNGLFGYKGKPGDVIDLDIINSELIEPVKESTRFKGQTIVLIDEMTYSAGIVFATTIQDHKLAKLVGQPTGGHANQTGNLAPFYLPNTKLLILAPSRYITRVSGDTRLHSVKPDFIVNDDSDPSLDLTLKMSQTLFNK